MALKAANGSDTVTPEMAARPFGKVFAAHRKKAGLTQAALVEAAGLPRAVTVSDIERGEYLPNIADLQKLARAMGTTLTELFADWEGVRRRPAPPEPFGVVASPVASRTEPAEAAPGKELVEVPTPLHRALYATLAGLPPDQIADLFGTASARLQQLHQGARREVRDEGDQAVGEGG